MCTKLIISKIFQSKLITAKFFKFNRDLRVRCWELRAFMLIFFSREASIFKIKFDIFFQFSHPFKQWNITFHGRNTQLSVIIPKWFIKLDIAFSSRENWEKKSETRVKKWIKFQKLDDRPSFHSWVRCLKILICYVACATHSSVVRFSQMKTMKCGNSGTVCTWSACSPKNSII